MIARLRLYLLERLARLLYADCPIPPVTPDMGWD